MTPRTKRRRPKGTGSTEELPSGRVRGRWREGTRMRSYTGDTKRDVEEHMQAALVDYRRRVAAGQAPQPLAAGQVSFDSVIDEWWATVERAVKPRTAERYEDHLAPIREHLGQTQLTMVDGKTLQRFVATLEQTYKPKTTRACMAVVMLILGHAHRMGDLDRLPPKPRLPRIEKPVLTIPTRGQVEDLATASDGRLWAPVLLAGYCGLREGELLALLASDVHLDDSPAWLLVRHARNKTSGAVESTKTDRIRRVYLPDRVVAALRDHTAEHPGEVVVPVSASVFQKSFERARTACGLRSVRPHDLRHAAASMMIAAGLNVMQVAHQLGHSDPAVTLRVYGHLWPDAFDEAMTKMNIYLTAA